MSKAGIFYRTILFIMAFTLCAGMALAQDNMNRGNQPGQGGMQPGQRNNQQKNPGMNNPQGRQLRFSEEEIAQALEEIKAQDPEFYENLMRMKENMPGEYQIILYETIERKRELERLKEENPELYQDMVKREEYERRERELSRKYRDAETDADKKKIETELKTVLNELFDLNLKMRRREVEELENRIKEIKSDIEERKKDKDKVIELHLKDITGQNDHLRW